MKFPAFKPIKLHVETPLFEVFEIELKNIFPDPHQPRKNFDVVKLDELSASIKVHGVIQPILVKKISEDDLYQIIAGERRWRAAQLADLTKIPCIIRELKNVNKVAISLIENIQRENLNSLEEAEAIQSLIQECGFTHKQVADTLGKSRTAVSNILRLLQLEEEVKEFIHSRQLEMGHARALLRMKGILQVTTAKQIISHQLSVRQAEKLVQKCDINDFKSQKKLKVFSIQLLTEWCEDLEKYISLKVVTQYSINNKGKVVIYFNNVTDAERLVEKLPIPAIDSSY